MRKNILLILMVTSLAILLLACGSDVKDEEELGRGDERLEEEEQEEIVEDEEDEADEEVEEANKEEVVIAPDLFTLNENGEKVLLKNLSGEEVSLEDYRGKIVFLNFWATWCPHCDDEMPDFQRLIETHDDVVIVAVDVKEDPALVEDYIKKGGYDFEVVLDIDGHVANTYYISAFPTTYVIREDGTLSRWFPGRLTYEMMEDLLDIAREGL